MARAYTLPAPPEPPRFQIGPLTIPIAADVLEAWAKDARSGDRLAYAYGRQEMPDHATFAAARALRVAGRINTHLQRRTDGLGFDFLAVRRRDEAPAAEAAPAPPAIEDEAMEKIFRALKRAANFGLVCPTDAELALECGLKNAAAARYRRDLCAAAGWIRVENQGPNWRRIVTIVGTGKRTKPGRLS